GILPNPDKRAGFPRGLEALAKFLGMVMGDIRRDVALQRLYGGYPTESALWWGFRIYEWLELPNS
ncbi:MAG: hypothetical protein D6675_12670, partial [Gemmatimonadetes bacterium]